jgi:type IV secretory pathway VirB2 component (pilin)
VCNIPPGQTGGTCVPAGSVCTPACGAGQLCVAGKCQVQAQSCSATAPCPAGKQCNALGVCEAACTPACTGGNICTNGTCTTPNYSDGGGPSGPIGGFVSLTKIAAFEAAGNSATLPDFLNNLYKICIGIAAVLAVLQIMRAGVMYMGGDSVTEKSQAKSIITQSLLGLLLVLSPTIIFGIINKDILSLKINNLDKLQVLNSASQTVADSILWSDDKSTYGTASVRCLQEGRCLSGCFMPFDRLNRSCTYSFGWYLYRYLGDYLQVTGRENTDC